MLLLLKGTILKLLGLFMCTTLIVPEMRRQFGTAPIMLLLVFVMEDKMLQFDANVSCFLLLLLPAHASEQGNVIGPVHIYIYIYIYICVQKNCN